LLYPPLREVPKDLMKSYVTMMTDGSRGFKNDQDQNSLVSMGKVWKTDERGTDTWQGVKRVC